MNGPGLRFFTEDFGFFTPVECGYPRLSAHWCLSRDGDVAGYALYRRHYSAAKNRRPDDGHCRCRRQFVGPGEKLVLLGTDARALFVWRRSQFRLDGQSGVNCAVFRNEGAAPQLHADRRGVRPGLAEMAGRAAVHLCRSEPDPAQARSRPLLPAGGVEARGEEPGRSSHFHAGLHGRRDGYGGACPMSLRPS